MRILNLFVLTFLLSASVAAQIPQAAAIDSIFAQWDQPGVPGCTLGIMKDGKLIYTRGYGMANLEYDIPNTDSSVFRIGSTSKQFTAACIIRLVQQGKLSLDNTLDTFYPEFPAYAKKITIRHLLNHTSGIRDYLVISYLKGLGDDDYYTDEDVMQWMTHQAELNFEPGAEHLYSNTGYWLLGQIVNKVAGMNMAEYAQKEIFTPLGMKHTHFHTDHTQIVKYRASGYEPGDSNDYKICMTTLGIIGDGGIFTTIRDLKKWDDAYYSSTVLNRQFWNMMTTPGKLNNGDTIDYACGLVVDSYKGLKTIWHGGAFVGYRAEMLRFPDQHFAVTILANRADANPTNMAFKVAKIFLRDQFVKEEKKELVKEEPAKEPETVFTKEQLTGTYTVQPGADMEINIKDDSLNFKQSWNNATSNLATKGGNKYTIPGVNNISFTFTNLKDGKTQTMSIEQNGDVTDCKRKKEINLSATQQKEYTGDYYSAELGITYNVYLEEGKLNVKIGDDEGTDMELYDTDGFTSEGLTYRFQRKDKKITGFELDAGRVKNIRFEKRL